MLAKLDLPADASENRRVHAVLAFLDASRSRDPDSTGPRFIDTRSPTARKVRL
jgi:hypothetical protein